MVFFRWVNSESLPSIFLLLLFPLTKVPQIFSYRLVNFQFQNFNTFWTTVRLLHSSLSKELDLGGWFLDGLFWTCPIFYWTFKWPFSMTIFLGHLHLIQGNFFYLFVNGLLPHSSCFFSLFYKSVFVEQWVLCIHIRPMVKFLELGLSSWFFGYQHLPTNSFHWSIFSIKMQIISLVFFKSLNMLYVASIKCFGWMT